VEDFLVLQAGAYAKEAETTEVTVRKIQFYKVAALAYASAGNSLESSNNDIKAGVLEEKYDEEMKYANALHSKANEEYRASKSLVGGDVFSKVSAYVLSRSALLNYKEAKVYFSYHHETGKITQVENMVDEVNLTRQGLIKELVIYFGGVSIFLAALAVFMVHRINIWKRDSYDHLLGNELVQVSKNEM
jgi:adenosine deaminase